MIFTLAGFFFNDAKTHIYATLSMIGRVGEILLTPCHTFGGASFSWFDVSYFRPWISTHQLVDLEDEDRNGTLYYLTSGFEVK